jgi:hypothetical protein
VRDVAYELLLRFERVASGRERDARDDVAKEDSDQKYDPDENE